MSYFELRAVIFSVFAFYHVNCVISRGHQTEEIRKEVENIGLEQARLKVLMRNSISLKLKAWLI